MQGAIMRLKLTRAVATLGIGALLLAACGGDGDDDPLGAMEEEAGEEDDGAAAEDPEAPDLDEDDVEIFSWWTGAGEEAGLLALIEMFEEDTGYSVVNSAVAGGAGTDARAVLASRMQAGDPPSTFQIHASRALLDTWVAADAMEPIGFLYDEEGWRDTFPESVIEQVTGDDGEIYSVPVNVHRSNVVFANASVLEEAGVELPGSHEEFLEAAAAIEEAGFTPLALGDNETWTLPHTWEGVLLASVGPDMYLDLFAGEADWTSPEVIESFENLDEMFQYVNDDHAARNWQDAAQLVADGEAAMTIMGDWAAGYFATDLGLEPETDFSWAPTPGTDGMFITVIDTFGLPGDGPNREGTIEWLRLLGSVEGQDTFNPLKGSIPARTDAEISQYNAYGQATYEEFQTDDLLPSLAHNSAAPPNFTDEALQVLEIFMSQRDPQQAADALERAADDYLRG
jgi:glucose/mannose transport system substrate-binding protein